MNNKILKNIFKIWIIALLILVILKLSTSFLNAWNNSTQNQTTNKTTYRTINSSDISKTWVAITTNIWIKYSQTTKISPTIYQEYFSVEEIKSNKQKAKETLINQHMMILKEYLSLLKTDFKSTILNANDRAKALEWVYNQLQIRYNNTVNAISNLSKQREILVAEVDSLATQIEAVKARISINYKNVNTEELNEDLEKYLQLKNDYTYVRMYVIFINNFLNTYDSLNKYTLDFITSLRLNRDAIIKWSYVVLPSSWKEFLKDYGLLYTESEYEAKIKAEENK